MHNLLQATIVVVNRDCWPSCRCHRRMVCWLQYTCTHMDTYTHANTGVHKCLLVRKYGCRDTDAHMHAHKHTSTHARTHPCTHAYIHNVRVCMCRHTWLHGGTTEKMVHCSIDSRKCTDMCVTMCTYMCMHRHVNGHMYRHICTDVCTHVYWHAIGMCMDMTCV